MSTHSLINLLRVSLLVLFAQLAFATLAHAQITLDGRVLYTTGEPAAGATVTMTKTVYDVTPNVVTTQNTTTDSAGHYAFQDEARCSVVYEFQAMSLEIVDGESLPPSNRTSTSGCVLQSSTLPDIQIIKPHIITLSGNVTDQTGTPVQGLTLTMTRTKYDLNPNVVTTATTTTDGSGHYQFNTYSRCSVVEDFRASIGSYIFQGGTSTSGCVLSSNDSLNFPINLGSLENAGKTSCNGNVGRPVNVTNGNVYSQQTDFQLPGAGEAIAVTRTYNSISQRIGLFGRGWTTPYDESVATNASNQLELTMPDGRLVTFATPDFFGQIIKNGDGSYTATFKDGRVHQFNTSGKLLSLTDRNGNQTFLTYDANGRLLSVTDPFALVLTVTTNGNGRVLSLSDSLGTIATYTYGGSDELLTVTYGDNSGYHLSYAGIPAGLALASITDALGNTIEQHDYDTQGRATTSQAQGGVERYTLNYLSSTQTNVTDALGHVTEYFYLSVKGRKVVTRVEGLCSCGTGSQTQSWTYDNQLNVVSHSNALGQVATYVYDANGNELSATGVLGSSSFTYNQFGEVLTATDAMGGVTTNTFDAAGNLLSITDALNNTTAVTYDARGELLTMTNELGKVTTLTWDGSGRLTQLKNALNNTTTFAYDARARLTSATSALNFTTSYAYDAAGRMNKITRPDNTFITFTYDLAGRRTRVTDALNNSTSFAYDGAYRLTGQTDALGKSVSYTYDLMSNLTAATDQLAHTTNIDYDEFNRPIRTTYPPAVVGGTRLQETVEYDAVGNLTKRTDTAGRVTTFAYDNANRLVTVTDPALELTQYEYNARSNVTAVVDALSQRYEFAYDALSRVTSATRAGMMMSFAYDAVGNRIQRTDYNNLTTNYAYDALNRLTNVTYPDASTATYAYDKLSQMTSATNLNGTVSFVYDSLGRVTSTTDVWGQVINYTYDANNRRTRMSFGGTTQATYSYDTVNRLTRITDNSKLAVTYAYDAASKLTSRTLPNSVVTTYTYDGLDRLTRLKAAKGNKLIADNNHTYNSAGVITQNIDQSGTHAYGYDALDRLTSATYTGAPNESYAYDAVGNRIASQRSASYSYQPFNRLTTTSTTSYLYDNNGNLTTKTEGSGTTHFQWDFENRLTQAVTPSAGSVAYKYDALGRRIQNAPSNGLPTNFTYDGDDVAQDRMSDGTITEYLNGPGIDNKIRQKGASNKTTYYFTQDHLGSTTALTNTNGALVERESYDAYGNSAGSANTRYGYTGRERDSLTGLMYYRARFYDPQLGRFISEDPIGLGGGINSFAYVRNNPQNRVDPSGLYEIDVHYYLTYFLAMKTGCFTGAEARLIADANQSTDENESTAPGLGLTEKQRQQNRDYHDLHPGNYEGEGSPELWQQAMTGQTNHVALGRYLHSLQDSFSHVGFESDVIGHLSRLHYYDKTASDVPRALRMAGATWRALNDYAKEKKCGCRGQWDSSWWQQVVDFSRYNGANFDALETIDSNGEILNFGMTNNPLYLLRKIRVLDLEPR
jgi:RHS repeat-associated protein